MVWHLSFGGTKRFSKRGLRHSSSRWCIRKMCMNKIKLFVMDVDGTLTDGKIYMGKKGEIMKAFDVKDGYGIAHILPKLGIVPAIITGRESQIVANRAAAEKYKCNTDNIAYIGDDLNDLPCIEYCALTACPADAYWKVKKAVSYLCKSNGGCGAVREFIDFIEEQYEASSDTVRSGENGKSNLQAF